MITLDAIRDELKRAGIDVDGIDIDFEDVNQPNEKPNPDEVGPFRKDGPVYQRMEEVINSNWEAGTSGLFKGKGNDITCTIKLSAIEALRLVQFLSQYADEIVPESYDQVEKVVLAILNGVGNAMASHTIKTGG